MNLMLVFQQGDAVLTAVFLCLIVMSILTWTLIVLRSLQLWRTRRANAQVEKAVWAASDWSAALNTIADSPAPLAQLAREGVEAASHYRVHAGQSLGQACGLDEYLTRALRRGLMREAARLESGMTLLASVGSTAPLCRLVRYGMGDLSRAGRYRRQWSGRYRCGGRADRRSAGRDGCRSCRCDSGGAGLQRLYPATAGPVAADGSLRP